jgi:hypothetical protein
MKPHKPLFPPFYITVWYNCITDLFKIRDQNESRLGTMVHVYNSLNLTSEIYHINSATFKITSRYNEPNVAAPESAIN